MSDTVAGPIGRVGSDIPEYPMARAAGCPLAPAPIAMQLNAVKPLSRVRIWDGSTPWPSPATPTSHSPVRIVVTRGG